MWHRLHSAAPDRRSRTICWQSYGWKLQASGTNLSTTAQPDTTGAGGNTLRPGDIVYITLPGSGQHAFQFWPVPTNYNPGLQPSPYGANSGYTDYYIQFVSVDGSGATLSVPNDVHAAFNDRADLQYDAENNEFFDTLTGKPYNPALADFGNAYQVKTTDGSVFNLNATTGKLTSSVDPNGNATTYAANSISENGYQLKIVRNGPAGTISSIYLADASGTMIGNPITYSYDSLDNLTSVTNRVSQTTQYHYDTDPARTHYLTQVISPNNVAGLTATYNDANQLATLTDPTGASANTGVNSDGASGSQTVTDLLGNATENVYDSHGDVARQIQTIKDGSGNVTGYLVTVHDYQYGSLDVLAAVETGGANANRLFSQTDYQPFQITGTDAAGARYTQSPTQIAQQTNFKVLDGTDGDGSDPDLGLPTSVSTLGASGAMQTTTFANYVNEKPGDITDPFGNVTHNAYDANGNLASTTTQYGTANAETTYFTYTDGTGATASLPKGLLLETYQLRPNGTGGTRHVTLSLNTYYDGSAPLGSQYQLHTTTDVNGVTHTYTYDSLGDQTSDSEVWTNPSNPSDVEVIENDTTYDAEGRETGSLSGKVTNQSTGVTIKPGTSTATHYNSAGQVDWTADEFGNKTYNRYDISGHLIETVNPDGTVVRTVFDAMGRPVWVTDRFNPADGAPSGTETIYNSLGQAVQTLRFRNVDIQVTANATYSGVYDVAFTPPTGSPVSSTQTFYTAQGWIDHVIGADGQTTAYTYYPNGQPHTVTTAAGTADAATTTYVYHSAPTSGDNGNYQLVTDPRGNTTRTDRDSQGRTIKVTYDVNADGSIPSGAISTSTAYSLYGQTVTTTDELGRVTVRKYDDAGNLVEVDQPQVADPGNGGAMTTPVTKYGYDAYGDEISQTDANGHVTGFTFDALGNQTGRTLPDGETESTTYGVFGQVLTATDFKGQTTGYVYDDSATGDGRMTGEYFFAAGVAALDGSGNVQTSLASDSIVFTFDHLGRPATITDSTGVTTDSYDADGNLSKQVKPEGTINYVYDPATGRLLETWTGTTRSAEGTDTSYGYDNQGRLHSTTVTVLNGVTLTSAQITIDTYYANGDKATELLPNGMLTTYTYNGRDQLTDEIVTKGGTNVFVQHYTLADNGRREAVSETQYTDGSVFSTSSTNWGYDNLDRLTGEDYTSNVAGQSYADAFSYDLVGNRMTKTHITGTDTESIAYGYNNDDQLQTETGTLNGSPEYATTYVDDANGSLITKIRTGTAPETDSYTYNLQNELASSTVNGVTTTYGTDAAGDRVAQTSAGSTTTSLVDDNNLTGYSQLLEQSTAGTITTSYVVGDRVVGQGSAGTSAYLVVDGQGSTRLVTDATGTVTDRYSYDAFGNALGFTASGAATSILYTGQQFDSGLSEYHLRARDYDASIGRLSSFDSANNSNGDPTDLHKYMYAGGNPINDFDPTGHDDFSLSGLLTSLGNVAVLVSTYAVPLVHAASPALTLLAFATFAADPDAAGQFLATGGDPEALIADLVQIPGLIANDAKSVVLFGRSILSEAKELGIAGEEILGLRNSLNQASGEIFERDVLQSLGERGGNRVSYTTNTRAGATTTIPDLPVGLKYGVTDIKSGAEITFTPQLQAQARVAKVHNVPFNLIIGPETTTIARDVASAISDSNGILVEFNSATRTWAYRVLNGNTVVR